MGEDQFYIGNEQGHRYLRVYGSRKYKAIAEHRAVWMMTTNSVIPYGWEIHHIDGDVTNNLFDNLMCLHHLDHDKFHKAYTREVPF